MKEKGRQLSLVIYQSEDISRRFLVYCYIYQGLVQVTIDYEERFNIDDFVINFLLSKYFKNFLILGIIELFFLIYL